MSSFLVRGPARLSGHFQPVGNKNAALPIIAACLLAEGPVTLRNVPMIGDVESLLAILEEMGARVDRRGGGTILIDTRNVDSPEVSAERAGVIRASILLAGPLLARFGEVVIPPPGGDVIGRRRIDTHVRGLTAIGARYKYEGGHSFTADELIGADVFLDEPSVTATENLIMAASKARGTTVIQNAACEPHIQDLCHFLNSLGARITGIASNILTIEGAESLTGGEHAIVPDHIEIGSMIVLAAVTGSEITIGGIRSGEIRPINLAWQRLGIDYHLQSDGSALVCSHQNLTVSPDLGGAVPKIEDGPWPSFPADLTSIAVVAATQATGSVMIHEKMFESRMFFVDRLIGMGARIVLCDPHRVMVLGPTPLRASPLASPDIRAGMALLIAALAADGQSRIDHVEQIERGYEAIDSRLTALGAQIERLPVPNQHLYPVSTERRTPKKRRKITPPTPPPKGLRLFDRQLRPSSWADAFRETVMEMHARHPDIYQETILSLPRWIRSSGDSRLAYPLDSEPPHRYSTVIGGVRIFDGYNALGSKEAVDIVLNGFGYDADAVRQWTI